MTRRRLIGAGLYAALFISLSCAGPQKPDDDSSEADEQLSEQTSGEEHPGAGTPTASTDSSTADSSTADSSIADKQDGPGAVVDVVAGGQHACALHETGEVSCWGRNHFGQLGDATTDDRWWAAPVTGLDDATRLAAGAAHTCALHESGEVSCWGAKVNGLTGDGGSWGEKRRQKAVTEPTRVTGIGGIRKRGRGTSFMCSESTKLEGIVDLDAGYMQTCAVHKSGGVVCWGSETQDQRVSDRVVPCPLPIYGNVRDAKQVFVGDDYVCALQADGQAKCWGAMTTDKFGAERPDDGYNPHVRVRKLAGVESPTDLSPDRVNNCALRGDGAVVCWGGNQRSLLPTDQDSVGFATAVEGLGQVVDIAAGGGFRCAVQANGQAACWGSAKHLFTEKPEDAAENASATPVFVEGVTGAKKIAAGGSQRLDAKEEYDGRYFEGRQKYIHEEFACVTDAGGGVQCWGSNSHGQLGRRPEPGASTPDDAQPVVVSSVSFKKPRNLEPRPENKEKGDAYRPPSSGELMAAMLFGSRSDQDVDCPEMGEFGDKAASNHLRMSFQGQTRLFHFDRVVVNPGSKALEIVLPAVRYHTGPLDKRVEHGWQQLTLRARLPERGKPGQRLPLSVDSEELPRQLGCFVTPPLLGGELIIERYRAPQIGGDGGYLAGRVEVYAGSAEFGAITLDFETDQFATRLPEKLELDPSQNKFSGRKKTSQADNGSVTYDAGRRTLKVELHEKVETDNSRRRGFTNRDKYSFVFEDVDFHPGTFVTENHQQYHVLHLDKFGPGGVSGTHRVIERDRKEEKRARNDERDEPPKLMSRLVEEKAEKKELSFSREQGEFRASFAADQLTRVPAMRSYEVDDPAFETPMDVEAQPFVFENLPDELPQLVLEQYRRLEEVTKDQEASRLTVYRSEPATVDGESLWRLAEDELRRRDDTFVSNPAIDKMVLVDPKSLRPRLTEMRFTGDGDSLSEWYNSTVQVRAHWRDGQVRVEASNPKQGDDTHTLELPEDVPVFDSSQTLLVLPYLPIEDGYATTWKMLDIDADQGRRYSTSGWTGTYYRIEPRLVDVSLQVQRAETFKLGEREVETYRARLEVPKLPEQTGTVWLEKTAPHRVVAFSRGKGRGVGLAAPNGKPSKAASKTLAKTLAKMPLEVESNTGLAGFIESYASCKQATYKANGIPGGMTTEFKVVGPKDDGCQLRMKILDGHDDFAGKQVTCTLPTDKEFAVVEEAIMDGLDDEELEFPCTGTLRDYILEQDRKRRERYEKRRESE
jgi:alpha-tubulin suppressor-like RCC1 family protein